MINIILSGASGQMGQAISRLAANRDDVKIVAGLAVESGMSSHGYNIYSDPSKCTEKADILIDFSHPSALEGVIGLCLARKIPLIMCTTGLSKEQNQLIERASLQIPILQSSNMSMGVLFFHKLVKMAAQELYGKYDIEIVEAHHNQKADAPSGTAAAIFGTIKSVVPDVYPVYERHSVSQKRGKNEVGMHSIRGGAIVGMHEVVFAGQSECIRLSHNAFSKDIFAAGSLDATAFLIKQAPGLYTMNDITKN